MDYERPAAAVCCNCGRTFTVKPTGRTPLYCRPACRVRAYEKRQQGPKVSPADRQRMLIWRVLQDAGVIPADKPLPMPKREGAA